MPDGKLNAGLKLSEAISLIRARIDSSYIGTETFVSLTNVRDVNVLVSGNAYNPEYTLSAVIQIYYMLLLLQVESVNMVAIERLI